MRELTIKCLESRQQAFDDAVRRTPDIDRFCSSSFWVLPAWRAFLPDHKLWARETDHGFILLGVGNDHSLGTYVHPLEASWALASPFAGADVTALTREFVTLTQTSTLNWDILFLSGISPDSRQFHELIRGFRGHFSLGLGPSSVRRIASLDDGVEGFLGRRSSKFRHNLRRTRRRGRDAGIQSELIRTATPEESLHLLDRALAIEARSWKANADTGILDGPMTTFYRNMLPRLARHDALRFLFLTLDGVDIAYCFGGVFADTFRGLQMSFADDHRSHAPGTLAQLIMIEELTAEGVLSYDLGSDMEYKRDWAETSMETLAVIVRRI